jgi:hypothetical protein
LKKRAPIFVAWLPEHQRGIECIGRRQPSLLETKEHLLVTHAVIARSSGKRILELLLNTCVEILVEYCPVGM